MSAIFQRFRVLIEIKRIQSYLFAVPKMRAVLGANALMGEMLRIGLPNLASTQCVPAAFGIKSQWKNNYDPLADCDDWKGDNPEYSYGKGILTRDGGHFQALFDKEENLQLFAHEARVHISENLPGLAFDIRIESWKPESSDPKLVAGWKPIENKDHATTQALDIFELPGKVCAWSGQGRADQTIPLGKETAHVSMATKKQWDAGTRFRERETGDIVGMLYKIRDKNKNPILPCCTNDWSHADDLKALAGGAGRYLAFIHVDGNGVGKRKPEPDAAPLGSKETREMAFNRWLKSEAETEVFFYSMRSSVRAALTESLAKTFGQLAPDTFDGTVPYQLLMAGGDDLLLITRAEYALPWLVAYAEALDVKLLSDGRPLDVGAGVIISRPSFPFHSLHALAEELAASAKRLARDENGKGKGCSVADWMILSESASPGVEAHRRQHGLVRYSVGASKETLVLSGRPYFILPQSSKETAALPSAPPTSLSELLDAAKIIRQDSDQVARSQRKAMPQAVRQGRRAAINAIIDLPPSMRKLLDELRVCQKSDPWEPNKNDTSPEENFLMTRLLDLLEICEIPDLGSQHDEADSSGGKAA